MSFVKPKHHWSINAFGMFFLQPSTKPSSWETVASYLFVLTALLTTCFSTPHEAVILGDCDFFIFSC
jgi:hypothetical protein